MWLKDASDQNATELPMEQLVSHFMIFHDSMSFDAAIFLCSNCHKFCLWEFLQPGFCALSHDLVSLGEHLCFMISNAPGRVT